MLTSGSENCLYSVSLKTCRKQIIKRKEEHKGAVLDHVHNRAGFSKIRSCSSQKEESIRYLRESKSYISYTKS